MRAALKMLISLSMVLIFTCVVYGDAKSSKTDKPKVAKPVYEVDGFKLGMSRDKYYANVKEFDESKTIGAWYIEDDLGSWYYQQEGGHQIQADFNHNGITFITATRDITREEFDAKLSDMNKKYGKAVAYPPEYALKLQAFKLIKIAAEHDEFYFWDDPKKELVVIVGYYDDRYTLIVDLFQNVHYLVRCLAVQCSCRFIGKYYPGFRYQCPGNRNPLLLPIG